MPKLPFLERLDSGIPVVADGAMATQLHRSGLPMATCFEAVNLADPDKIYAVHSAYLAAGAELLETNTFGANRQKLSEHGLSDKLAEINGAAVEIARRAIADSGRDAYIAGSMGPLGQKIRPYGPISREDARGMFFEQAAALIAAGVDVILLETFADHHELLEALAAVRLVSPDVPVVTHATFASDDRTLTGFTPAKVAADLVRAGADVIGVNCAGGPAQISHILETMHTCVPRARLSAMPNAGFPESVNGRVMYPASAEYFGDYALTFQASARGSWADAAVAHPITSRRCAARLTQLRAENGLYRLSTSRRPPSAKIRSRRPRRPTSPNGSQAANSPSRSRWRRRAASASSV